MKYDETIIPVCSACDADDSETTKICERCGVAYCRHFASNIDFRYCGNCLDDFRVTESIEIKVTEYRNPETDEVTSRKRQMCKRLHLSGTDYLFVSQKIGTLSDEELTTTIEYHRAIASLMMNEKEIRKIEENKKLQKVRLSFSNTPDTSKKRVKTEKTANTPNKAAVIGALTVLFKRTPTDAEINAFMKAAKIL